MRGGRGGRGGKVWRVKRGGKGWKVVGLWKGWVCGGVLIHSSVQTARLCPSLPSPFFTKCRLAASAACTWVKKEEGEGGALVSTQTNTLSRNWSGGRVKNPGEFCPFKKGMQECGCTKLMYGVKMKRSPKGPKPNV